jgi:hypothetical protein
LVPPSVILPFTVSAAEPSAVPAEPSEEPGAEPEPVLEQEPEPVTEPEPEPVAKPLPLQPQVVPVPVPVVPITPEAIPLSPIAPEPLATPFPLESAEPAEITGLPLDENGEMFFELTHGGEPMEVRIDIPLEDFEDLYVDGELWVLGADYTIRSGSTIIIVTAERLEQLADGAHAISAVFAGQTVDLSFNLSKRETSDTSIAISRGGGLSHASLPVSDLVDFNGTGLAKSMPFVVGVPAIILLVIAFAITQVRSSRLETAAKVDEASKKDIKYF